MYDTDFKLEDGILHVRLTGVFPREFLVSGENLFHRLVDACSANDCRAALVDARELQVDFDTLELFRAGADIATATRPGIRVALVARADMVDRFFVDVAVNRGGNVEVFTQPDEARTWLADGRSAP